MTATTGWTIDDWRRAYREQRLSPESALQALRAQLSPDDPAWIHILTEQQLDDQLAQLRSPEEQPLYGVPFVIKDNIDAAGLPTTAACPAYAYTAEADAPTLARLKEAGAVLLAKANLDQFATGLVGTRSPYGAVPNAFNPDYVSGGSSSGSAVAVARGLVPFSLGTDTAGSGRVPAGFNNIVGLKPTKGRFSIRGVVPACKSLDCVSVFALNVADAEQVAETLTADDPEDGYSRSAPRPTRYWSERPRLGIPERPEWFGDGACERAWQAALERLEAMGVELVPVDFTPMRTLAELLYGGPPVAERHAAIAEFMAEQADQMNPVVRGIIEQAAGFSATDAYRAEYTRADLARRIQDTLATLDALLVPTAPRLPSIEQVSADPVRVNSQLGTWTNFVNLADCSALALPAGMREDGLPFGITLIGTAWQDAALAEFGRRWQRTERWTRGATGLPQPDPATTTAPPPGHVRLAVVGAHLSGMPLNGQLTERAARRIETTTTDTGYRLFALPGTQPPKPGLIRAERGGAIEVELWDMPLDQFGSFVELIPPPLGMGTLTLADGRLVKGFICEGAAVAEAQEITHLGGWRAFINS